MSSENSRELFKKYAAAVVYVNVELPNGDQSIGTAFHVGSGVFITARHVVDGTKILEVANTTDYYVPDESGNMTIHGKEGTYRSISSSKGKVVGEPYFHPDESVDIAALIIEGIECPVIPLGSHLDDWMNDEEFSLAQVVIMGYPPVPFSKGPTLISSRAEVNAVIDKYTGGHPHFIVSSIARGGFSGGPCLIEWNFALGVVTESLVESDGSPESGYMAVISIEPVYVCLSHHGIFPKEQAEGWDGFWDKTG
ncbi:TPA: trypsin-like peptidase domain-containing protein [Vibrio parahaemolyticus]